MIKVREVASYIDRCRRKPWSRRLAPVVSIICALLLVESVARGGVINSICWLFSSPGPVVLNMLIAAMLMALLAFVAGNPRYGALAALGVLAVMAAIHGGKMLVLGEAFYPWDILLARETLNVFGRGYFPFGASQVVFFLVLLAGAIVPVLSLPRKPIPWRLRVVMSPILLAAIIGIGSYRSWGLRHVIGAMITEFTWDQKQNHNTNGLLLAFTINMQSSIVLAPDNYSAQTMAHLSRRIVDTAGPMTRVQSGSPRTANLIVMLSESFWDPVDMQAIEFDTDPLVNYHRLGRSHTTFNVISPVFGGLTCNAEFELMTALPVALLPQGAIPYQQHIRRPMPALPAILREHGYSTIAVHPFHRWFWNRHNVYECIGFDKFISLEDHDGWTIRGDYVSDLDLADTIVDIASQQQEPYFIFALSMQNHGPYEHRRYNSGDHNMNVIGEDLDEATLAAITNMAKGLQDADAALAKLVEHFEKLDQPTMVVFLGDHLPHLGKDYDLYRRCGLVSETGPLSLDEQRRLRTVPALIWTNYEDDFEAPPDISMSYVMPLILKKLGIDKSIPLHGFLVEFQNRYPLFNDHFHLKDDTLTPGIPQDDPMVADMRMILYDLLIGEGHSVHDLLGVTCQKGQSGS